MTYEAEEVARALVRHHIERAMSEAARLPEFRGRSTIALLSEALVANDGRIAAPKPLRKFAVVGGRGFWPRPAPETADCFAAATDDGREPEGAA